MISKRKYHVGRVVQERWIFGMFDSTERIGFLQFVEDRSCVTLLPIIENHVLPGSEIHSDSWAAYMGGAIPAIPIIPPYIHKAVNHTQNFVDPVTGAHTNNVENFWNNAKAKNKAMSGTTQEMLPSYLDEFMWRQIYGKKTTEAFDNILHQISVFYQVK